MIIHKSCAINLFWSFIIAITCIVGDRKLHTTREPLLKAIIDNSVHGLVGLFSAVIVVRNIYEELHFIIACMTISSMIDFDHFIAAKSLSLSDATSLSSRPFLHNSSIPFIVFILLIYCHFTSRSQNLITSLVIIIVAFATHHIRDANRRGLWFAPFGSSPPLSNHLYIILTILIPYIFKFFVNDTFKYKMRTTIIDV